jgi:hypothetical protein
MMTKLTPQPSPNDAFSRRAIWNRIRAAAVDAGEGALRELPSTLRRLRTLLLVLSITVPVFLGGLLVVLWHFAH